MTNAQAEARAVVALLAEEMRSGLTGVTPGPWILIPAIPYDGDDDGLEGAFVEPAGIEGSDGNPVCIFGSALGSGSLFENERDHEHINRCHPDNIRALLDDRDAIAGQNAELRAEIAALKKEAADVVRPFAKRGELTVSPRDYGFKELTDGDRIDVKIGDCRAARSFLDKWEGRDG
jgi:hypothetical protein